MAARSINAYRAGQVSVGIDVGARHVVLLGEALDLVDKRDDGLELLVGLAQGGLELGMSINQALDLLQGVHNKHVNQVLAGAVQPIIKWL